MQYKSYFILNHYIGDNFFYRIDSTNRCRIRLSYAVYSLCVHNVSPKPFACLCVCARRYRTPPYKKSTRINDDGISYIFVRHIRSLVFMRFRRVGEYVLVIRANSLYSAVHVTAILLWFLIDGKTKNALIAANDRFSRTSVWVLVGEKQGKNLSKLDFVHATQVVLLLLFFFFPYNGNCIHYYQTCLF